MRDFIEYYPNLVSKKLFHMFQKRNILKLSFFYFNILEMFFYFSLLHDPDEVEITSTN